MPASRTITRRAAVATLFSTAGAAGVAAPPEPFEDRSLIRSTYLFQSRPPMTVSVMPVLRVLPGQRLICIWVSGGDSEPLDVNRPLISTSDDLGRTWSDAREFPAIEGRMTFCCEIEHQDGLTTAHLFSGRAADGYRTVTNHRAASSDGMATWSRRIVLDRGEYHGSRPPQKSRMGYDQQLAYPEAVEHRGKLYVAYDYNRRDVVFLEVNLERIA